MPWKLQNLPYPEEIETKPILKKIAKAHRALAELKGIAQTIPRQDILINTLTYQEAKDSSEIENIITTHDELYKSSLEIDSFISPAAKEVQNYVAALKRGYEIVKTKNILTTNHILEIQEILEKNKAGLRSLPGTSIKNQQTQEIVYAPPQHKDTIESLMNNLEQFINDPKVADYDPILKMAIIHFQFESIHPFYDGNGRTGRIINILYLVLEELLDIPILYLSGYIIKNKSQYYRYIQNVRDENNWHDWLCFMIDAVEYTALHTNSQILAIRLAMQEMKNVLRDNYKFYSQELLNHLFKQPYTKIDFLMKELNISRVTAGGYLNRLAKEGVLQKHKIGKSNYYINPKLIKAILPEN
ncbi:MAG: Fic family protein [Reichenbachiella sp.]